MRISKRHRGFTLIEMAIVIVIIALVMGSILVGREMIHAAQVRTVIGERDLFEVAITTFLNKYNGLPGDLPNATAFWGTDPNCIFGSPTPKQETCNGNGDHTINDWVVGPDLFMYERIRAWQHLANAGLIPGQYAASYAGFYPGGCDNIGISVPRTKIYADAGWEWQPFNSGTPNGFGQDAMGYYQTHYYGTLLSMGTCVNTPGDILTGGAISPIDVRSIDEKTDDGKPWGGRVVVNSFPPDCASSDVITTSTYLNSNDRTCKLFFDVPFP